MKNQDLFFLIEGFARKQSGPFEFEKLLKHAYRQKEFSEDDEDRLYDLACESRWLFEDERDLYAERFVPRHTAFNGAEFRVTPLEEEIAGGYLVPGHRFSPFLACDVFPADAVLKLPDGTETARRTVRQDVKEVHRFLLFFGQHGAVDYLISDCEENAEVIQPPFDGSVTMTVFDLAAFYKQCGFKAGDSLMLTVEDWLKGVFALRHVPAQKGILDFPSTQGWVEALRCGFDEALPDAGLDHNCVEQAARMLWLAECNEETPPVLRNPPLSLAAFFNSQQDLDIQTAGQVSFFWPKGEPIESRLLNSLADDIGMEPETELDGYFNLLGLSLNSDEAEAYMRNALSQGGAGADDVLARVIQGRVLSFPSAEEQKEFRRLWNELWKEVREKHDPQNDAHRDVRAVFLDLNDQCLAVLRELDSLEVAPSDLFNNPAHLQLGEFSSLISSALLMCNESGADPGEFPLPLDEMARDMSFAISEIAECMKNSGGTPSAMTQDDGPVYQLKISLKNSKPPIWRRVLVPSGITLDDLHWVIQKAFGWTNSHLHQFIDGRTFYLPGADDDEPFMGMETVDSIGVRLADLLRREKDKVVYEYDFGDSWEHTVLLEKILPPDPKQAVPVCIKGKRACPPEDCGGIFGYYHLLEILSGPDSDEKTSLLDWLGGTLDPEALDLDEINARLRTHRVGRR